jgi:mono/diheme cytochrome c family protein
MSHPASFSLLLFLLLPAARADDLPAPAARKVDFEKDVRPIFVASCYRCHGPKAAKGGLVLDRRDEALHGGDEGKVIIPGKSAESRLIRYVAGMDEDHVMPPEDAGKPLRPEQIGVLRAWIDGGADWPIAADRKNLAGTSHWAFQPPVRPALPTVKDVAWVRNPIDAFVLARLELEGLKHSPEADRASLLRRLSLDLIGLPPTLQELDAFLADKSADAYEKQVDRLLASPHYGERWARRWLDRARYADTNGYEKDRERSIWPYRDWVIDALNRDMPFDRFTIEQIAGDLLPNASPSQKIATGFHRNTMTNEEGGIDVEEFRFASVVDRVATTGTVWLGLTVQCAQCHTHKYDPITQRDYYRVFAFLNNTDEPELIVPDPAIESRRAAIEAEAAALERNRADHFPVRDESQDWLVLKPTHLDSTSGANLAANADGTIVASGKNPDTDAYRLEFDLAPGRYSEIRLETLADPKAPEPGPGRTKHSNFVVTDFKASLGPNQTPISLATARADIEQPTLTASKAIDGDPHTGWAIDDGSGRIRQPHAAIFSAREPFQAGPSGRVTIEIGQMYGGQHTLGRFRISARKGPAQVAGEREIEQRALHLASKQEVWERSLQTFDWDTPRPARILSKKHATMDLRPDGSILVRGDKPNNDVYEVDLDGNFAGVTALRLEVLTDPSLPDNGPGRAPLFAVGGFILSEIVIERIDGDKAIAVPVARATEDYAETGHPARLAIDGATDTGWTIGGGIGRSHAAVFTFREPIAKGTKLRVTLRQEGIHQTTIGRFRLSTSTAKDALASVLPAEIEALVRIPREKRTHAEADAIKAHYLSVAPEMSSYNKRIADLRHSKPRAPTTLVMEERRPSEARTTNIHKRGEFLQLSEAVEPGVPSFLAGLPSDAPRNRLGLARWIVAPENPLTARVLVNGTWQAFFGRGLVATLDDFGTRSAPPSHPELLDWLATETARMAWSQKALQRLIVSSATYRQSSKATPEAVARDPGNERLARGPRHRVDAEAVRDIALSLAGLLNPRIGGPSVYPPQPEGVTSLAYGQGAWPTSKGTDRYRRGLYTYIKRATPYATFGLFDAPTSEVTCVRRERSNTPLQALTMLNDPVYLEAAQAFADRVLREAPSTFDGRLRHAYRLCMAREPRADECRMIAAFLEAQRERVKRGELKPAAGPSLANCDPAEHAAWAAVARVLLNLDETITKE